MAGICGVAAGTTDSSTSPTLLVKCQRGCKTVCPNFRPRPWLARQLPARSVLGRRCTYLSATSSGRAVVPALNASAQTPGRDPHGDTTDPDYRRECLLEYVREVPVEVVKEFARIAPSQIVDAMQQTITNMLGSLPPEFFDVEVSTADNKLMQVMHTTIMLGYLYHSAQHRLELHQSLGLLLKVELDNSQTMGTMSALNAEKTNVQGEIVRWHDETGAEVMPADQYITELEDELKMLHAELEDRWKEIGQRNLLEYLSALGSRTLKELTAGIDEDILLAMDIFIKRMMGTVDNRSRTELLGISTNDLTKLFYWLMIVGHNLRTLEVRLDMGWTFNMPDSGMPEDG